MEKQLIEEISDGVATLTFNRPDRLRRVAKGWLRADRYRDPSKDEGGAFDAIAALPADREGGMQRRKALELLAPPPSRHDHSDGGIPRQSGRRFEQAFHNRC
jgi:hypothetical protein